MGLSYGSWIQRTFTGPLSYADFSFLTLLKAETNRLVLFCLINFDYWDQFLASLIGLCSCMRYYYPVYKDLFDGCYPCYHSFMIHHSIQAESDL